MRKNELLQKLQRGVELRKKLEDVENILRNVKYNIFEADLTKEQLTEYYKYLYLSVLGLDAETDNITDEEIKIAINELLDLRAAKMYDKVFAPSEKQRNMAYKLGITTEYSTSRHLSYHINYVLHNTPASDKQIKLINKLNKAIKKINIKNNICIPSFISMKLGNDLINKHCTLIAQAIGCSDLTNNDILALLPMILEEDKLKKISEEDIEVKNEEIEKLYEVIFNE